MRTVGGVSETVGLPVLVRPLRWGEPSMSEGNFAQPTGTVTLVLGDVEGSTRAWEVDPKTICFIERVGTVDADLCVRITPLGAVPRGY
jgi:hypothetical protein